MAFISILQFDELPLVDTTGSHTVVNNGVTISSTNAKVGFSSSGVFNKGQADHCHMAQSTDWDFGANPYTIHCWVYLYTRTQYDGIWTTLNAGPNDGMGISINNLGGVSFYIAPSGGYVIGSTAATVAIDDWTHIAIVRDATYIKLYINGTNPGDGTLTHSDNPIYTAAANTHGFRVGKFYADQNTFPLDGEVDELIVADTALWTEDFTPPSAPYSVPATPAIAFNNITLSNITI